MKVLIGVLAFVNFGLCQQTSVAIKSAEDFVGKRVTIVDRLPLCKPATFESDINRGGTQANVVSAKTPSGPKMSKGQILHMPAGQLRDMMIDQYGAAVLTLQFDDGTKLDTCGVPYGLRKLTDFLQLASGDKLVVEGFEPTATSATASVARLSDDDVRAALAGTGKDYWVYIQDAGFLSSYEAAQVQSISLWRPEAILNVRQESAKKQFVKYEPTDDERERALTVIASGYVSERVNVGCDSITRVVLLSDPDGSGLVKESYSEDTLASTWGNAFGASNTCGTLRAKFTMEDVKAVRASAKDGEFYVATFAGAQRTKIYKIKHKHQSKLNLDQMLMAKN